MPPVKTGPEVTAVIEEHGPRPPLLQAIAPTRLTKDELATEAESTPERIDKLVEIGAMAPGPDGAFERGDVIRARVVGAFEAEG